MASMKATSKGVGHGFRRAIAGLKACATPGGIIGGQHDTVISLRAQDRRWSAGPAQGASAVTQSRRCEGAPLACEMSDIVT